MPQERAFPWAVMGVVALTLFLNGCDGEDDNPCDALPDLVVTSVTRACSLETGKVILSAHVENQGGEGVGPGLPVAFYAGDPNTHGTLLGVYTVGDPLFPGDSVEATLEVPSAANLFADIFVVANDDGSGQRNYTECNEDNNAVSAGVSLDCDPTPTCTLPEFVVSVLTSSCNEVTGRVTLTAQVTNQGEADVASGVPVAFYVGDPSHSGTLLGVYPLPGTLLAGGTVDATLELPSQSHTSASISAVADDDGTGHGSVLECDETHNTASALMNLECEVPPPTTCVSIGLGDYTLFLTGDYSGGHNVTGKVAAGGNISMTHFSVGQSLPANDIANTLVAGGNLTLSQGRVWGDAHYGNTFSTDPSVVFSRGSPSQGTPIDFAALSAEMSTLSSGLAMIPSTGTVVVQPWGGIFLNGPGLGTNTFQVNASDLSNASLLSINAPADSLAIINIVGGSAATLRGGVTVSGGIDPHQVLFNFPSATSITASGYGLLGTLLAPQADVSFNNGSFEGAIFAHSLTGDAAGFPNPLHDVTICSATL